MNNNQELKDKAVKWLTENGIAFSAEHEDGFVAGYEQGKRDAQPGAVWVKGTSPDIKIGDYVAKFRPFGMHLKYDFLGMAFVSLEFIHFVCPGHYDLKWVKGHEELQYLQLLDESAAGREDAASLINWLNNEGWKPNDDGSWYNFITGLYNYTPDKVAELFKQQKEK